MIRIKYGLFFDSAVLGFSETPPGDHPRHKKKSPKLIELVHEGRSQSFESSIDWCHPYMVQLSPSFNYIYGPYSPAFFYFIF